MARLLNFKLPFRYRRIRAAVLIAQLVFGRLLAENGDSILTEDGDTLNYDG
jgi:hypothetical protein